jgi:hypothetical protein
MWALEGREGFLARARQTFPQCWIQIACLALSALQARAVEPSPSETNLISGNTPLWTESMLWDKQCAVYSGLGYNDNVLWSAFNPRGSPFFLNGLDLTVLRLPLDGWKVEGLLTGDDMRFWRYVGTDSEDLLISSVRVERELADGWRVGLEFRGLDEKQVLDISTSSGLPATALVDGYGITGRPSVRKDFNIGLWLQVDLSVTRWSLASPLDDYWEFGPVTTVGYNFGTHSDITASYGASYQPHDEWVALDFYGQPLPQHLEFFQDRTEFAWHQYWDPHQRLRSSARFVFAYDEDNGGGYLNYYQYQIVGDILWQTADWQIKASAQQAYELYPVEGVGRLNGQHLNRNFLNLSVEIERRLFKRLKAFGKAEYQRGRSNYVDGAGDYIARVFSGGLRWEF